MSRGMESEGGTGAADVKAGSYSAIERESARVPWPRRGCTVAISGEPGMHAYRVIGVDPAHGAALICRVGSTRESWRLPMAALTPLD